MFKDPAKTEFILNTITAIIFAIIIILLGYACILQNELIKEITRALLKY